MLVGTGSLWGGTGWFLLVMGQYNLVLLVIKLYWVSIGLLCLYILKNLEIWSDVTIAGRQTNEKGKIELLSHGPWKAEMSNLQILEASTYFLFLSIFGPVTGNGKNVVMKSLSMK